MKKNTPRARHVFCLFVCDIIAAQTMMGTFMRDLYGILTLTARPNDRSQTLLYLKSWELNRVYHVAPNSVTHILVTLVTAPYHAFETQMLCFQRALFAEMPQVRFTNRKKYRWKICAVYHIV